MAQFRPCLGKTACVDSDEGCRTCGRSHREISETRRLIDAVAQFALEAGYANHEDFAGYVARKVAAKIRHQLDAGVTSD